MAEQTIVTNVTVVDGTGCEPLRDAEVVIRDGRFSEIRRASGTRKPSDAGVFDGRGGYLLPGLWESHTHLRAREPLTLDAAADRLEGLLADYARAGITSVIELGGPLEVNTRLRERRRAAASGAANMLYAGPSFTGIDGWPLQLHHNHELVREVGDARAAQRLLDEVLAMGTDVVKIIYDGEPGAPDKLPREALGVLIAGAHARGRRVVVHIHTAQDVVDALEAGADGIEHTFVPQDPSTSSGQVPETERLIELFARTGAAFTPTFAVFEQIGRSGDAGYLDELERAGIISSDEAARAEAERPFASNFPHHPPDESRRRLEHGLATLARFRDAGVKIVAGSDVALFMSRPAALFRELQLLAQAGLAPREILVTATKHAAEKVGRGAESGTITAGKRADAVLMDRDPHADLMHVIAPQHRIATLREGRWESATAR